MWPRLAVALLLATSTTGSAIFLQTGGDAARTGAIDGAGPWLDEVAFEVPLPGRPGHAQPLWTERGLYVLVADLQVDETARATGIYEIDLDQATPRLHVDLPHYGTTRLLTTGGPPADVVMPPTWTADEERFYVMDDDGFDAYDIASGMLVWHWDRPTMLAQEDGTKCVEPALSDGRLYLVCNVFGRHTAGLPEAQQTQTVLFAVMIDAETGGTVDQWLWRRPPVDVEPLCQSAAIEADRLACALPTVGIAVGMSLVEGFVVLAYMPSPAVSQGVGLDPTDPCSRFSRDATIEYWAIASDDGRRDWRLSATGDATAPTGWVDFAVHPTGGSGELYLKLGNDFAVVDPQTGDILERIPLGREDTRNIITGAGFGMRGDRVYAPTSQSLYRVDLTNRSLEPERSLFKFPSEPVRFFSTSPILHGTDRLYFRSTEPGSCAHGVPGSDAITAYDIAQSKPLWTQTMDTGIRAPYQLGSYFSIDGDLAAWITGEGVLRVVGRTDASMDPRPFISTHRPAPGDEVVVDLSNTLAGIQGEATSYRADWGDGTVDEWQASPSFVHQYAERGAFEALLQVQNEAGQRSTEPATFLVGIEEPDGAFWPFLFAGLVGMAGTGVVVGVRRRSRRPRRLRAYRTAVRRELAESEEKGRPALVERLRPLRAALGVSLKEHERILTEERAGTGDGPAGARLFVGSTFLDRFLVLERLGSGAQGRAFLCKDTVAGREVVLKVARSPRHRDRVLREARAYAKVRSPHLVGLFDVDVVGHDVFMVLEFAGRGTLADVIANAPLSGTRVRALATRLLAALEALHEAGLAHGDVSPRNLFGTPNGGFILGDLGLAVPEGPATVVVQGGTPLFLAPELQDGGRPTPASDLYSAGRVLVAAATGDPRAVDRLAGPWRKWVEGFLAPAPERHLSARLARAGMPKSRPTVKKE